MENVELYKLKTLIKETKTRPDEKNVHMKPHKLEALLNGFHCERNDNIKKFISETAKEHQEQNISNTYVFLDDKKTNILAFFTLVQKEVDLSKYNLTDKQKKKWSSSSNQKFQNVSTVHIAQIAKNDKFLNKLTGSTLWQGIYQILSEWEAPFKLISLDCDNILVPYYEKYGFKKIEKITIINKIFMMKKRDEATFEF